MKKKRNRIRVKDSELKIRIATTKKEEIKQYCKKNNISMTKFIDIAIDNILDNNKV
jgi:antitoxin component of RelBE/YafQ-DinJ toxin-antitoxin module